jgi:hypothetical protein
MSIEIYSDFELPDYRKNPKYWIHMILTDLFFLSKVVLHHGKKKEYRDLNWIHKDLCDFLDFVKNPILQKLVLMSRDMLKSSIARALAIQWFLRKAFERALGAIFIYCGVLKLTEKHAEKIWNEILRNEIIQTLFHGLIPKKKSEFDVCSKDEGIHYKGIEIDLGSPEKSLTGCHYEGGINDNLVNEINSATIDQRDKIVRRWQEQESILIERAWEVIFETTWWPDDLSGRILHPEGKFDFLKIKGKPALKFLTDTGYSVFSCPARDEKREPVFPEKLDEEYLRRKRVKQGPYLHSALYDLQPVPEEDIVLKRSWIIHYEELPMPFIRNMSVDCAGTKKKESSFSAISLGDWSIFGKLHIPYAQKRKVTPMELLAWIEEIEYMSKEERRPITYIGIEKEKYGIFLADLLSSKRPDLMVVPIEIKSIPRPTRHSSLIPHYEGGDILSKPGLKDYEDEVVTYYREKEKGTDILDTIWNHFQMKLIPQKVKQPDFVPAIASDFEKQVRRERAAMGDRMKEVTRMF